MLDQNARASAPNAGSLPVEFRFKDLVVRTVSKDDEPWFVAADVCKALGIKNTTRAIAPLDQDEKGLYLMKTLGGAQDLSVVNEFGLYRLILRSDKAKAKEFQRWVIHDVLPTIRKTGRYETMQDDGAPEQTHLKTERQFFSGTRAGTPSQSCRTERPMCTEMNSSHWSRKPMKSILVFSVIR